MDRQKLVIFELLGYSSIFSVYWYSYRGYKIKYFSLKSKLQNQKWFNNFLVRHNVDKIRYEDFDLHQHYLSHDLALDNNELIYETWFAKSKLINEMESLLNSKQVHLVYKKDLVEKLQKFYDIYVWLNHISENIGHDIIFIPQDFTRFEKITKTILNSSIRIPFWARVYISLKEAFKKVIYIIALGFLPFIVLIWKTRKIKRNITSPKEFRIGIRVYKTDWGFNKKYRTIDFLLDGKKLNEDNTLFCVETDIDEEYMQKLNQKKYHVEEVPKILREIDINFIKNTIIKTIVPCCFKSSYLSLSEPSYVIMTTVGTIYKYIFWTRFNEKIHLKHFVAYNNFEKYHIVRNILLSHNGVKTLYYMHSMHSIDVFNNPREKILMRDITFSYLHYNNIISWGNKSNDTYICVPNYVTNYQKLGCLWSEHVRMILDGELTSNFKKNVFSDMAKKPIKIIGVFDTNFGDGVPLQVYDMVLFIEGILKILQNYPEIGVVLKEKGPEEIANSDLEISVVYDKLRSHERVYSTSWLGDPAEVIAMSDLIISACYSSTTIEALGARKKAIYFDASSRFKDSYYNKFPKMVANGYTELEDFIKYWLYEVNDKQFDEYIDTYVKGELDSYADGRAITRFRNLLSEENYDQFV